MVGQYLVIGVGRFGSAVATTLYDLGGEVVAVDLAESEVSEIKANVTHAAVVDATDESSLAQLGLRDFDAVIVAIGDNIEAAILATSAVKAGGARYVISKANDRTSARILASVGADEIVRPEHDMGLRLAEQLASPNRIASLELGTQHSIVEIEVRDRLNGALADLRLPDRFGVQVLAVHRGSEIEVAPGARFEIVAGDRLVVFGPNEGHDRLRDHVTR